MIIKILAGVVILLASLLLSVDFAFFLKDRYCRFHIGRWKNRGKWEKAVKKTVLRWIRHTPTVKITDNSRYVLLDMINGKYRSNTIQSWQKAAMILGLLESGNEKDYVEAQKTAEALLRPDGSWKRKPVAVDCGMLSYAVLKACDPNQCRKAMDESVSVIRSFVHKSGMICYTGSNQNPEMYVDTLGLSCPFLALYAKTFDVPDLEDLAVFQLKMYHNLGLYQETGLPNHAFNIGTKLPCGVYGWGRGTGWYLIGLLDTYAELVNPDNKQLILSYIRESAEKLIIFQRHDGGFGATLQRMSTYDSSATAVLAWFYAKAARLVMIESYQTVSSSAMDKLMKNTRISGAIDWCQGDTKGIGIFAQTYDIMPFAQGMTLRAIGELERNI